MDNNRNWAGNYQYGAAERHAPESVEQVQELTARSRRVKALGSRHSFNDIADTAGTQLSMEKLNRIVRLDKTAGRVTIEGGVRYGELSRYLHEHGYALHNLASLPHITVAGAVATATHGSGDRNGNLATAVHALEIVTASGDLVTLSRSRPEDDIAGAVVGLGALGIVTSLTLNVVPAYRVSQTVYEHLPLGTLEKRLDDIFGGAYSVSLFSDWKQAAFNQVWVKRVQEEADGAEPSAKTGSAARAAYYGALPADGPRHPVPGHPAESCSEQRNTPGPWHERLPHFRLEFTPSAGEELQSEYFVPRRHAYAALSEIAKLRERIAPLLYVSEIRTIAADDLWLSPCYGQDAVAIHFTWRPDWAGVRQLLPQIEQRLAPFEARPHWGKLFAMAPERVQALYARLPDFRRLMRRFDPEGKFRNDFLERYLAASLI